MFIYSVVRRATVFDRRGGSVAKDIYRRCDRNVGRFGRAAAVPAPRTRPETRLKRSRCTRRTRKCWPARRTARTSDARARTWFRPTT